MPSLFSILNLGSTGLKASELGVRTASHNITNVDTPGFHRRSLHLSPSSPLLSNGLSYGTGVRALGAPRTIDTVLERRLTGARAQSASSDARASVLGRANAMFGDLEGSGVTPGLDRFFSAFSSLATAPHDPSARSGALAATEALAGQIRQHGADLLTLRQDLNSDVQGTVNRVNELAGRVANLNRDIGHQSPPSEDLLDQRDAVMAELSTMVGIEARPSDGGGIDVIVAGTGHALVLGNGTSPLTTRSRADGTLGVEATFPSGVRDISVLVSGGRLGGTLVARDVDLAAAANQLDTFAFNFANAVNSVHAAGYGADGATGRNLFVVGATAAGAAGTFAVDPSVAGDPDALAAATNPAAVAGDNTNALALVALGDSASVNGRTPGAALRGVLEGLSERIASAEISSVASSRSYQQMMDLQQSVSGVSVDEEMASLVQFRQAYAAAAQIIRTADELLNEVIGLKR